MKRWWWLVAPPVLAALVLIGSNLAVEDAARGLTYATVADLPVREVGLLLGTSPTALGQPNRYYRARIEAAAAAYRAGKVRVLLVSGDNAHASYNEPRAMRRDLIAAGVPGAHIALDYAGFRTLDSVLRANKVFGQTRFTVISQQWHNERAIYTARAYGLDAIGLNARDVTGAAGWRVALRENLARVSAVLDARVLHRQPKFAGPAVALPDLDAPTLK